MNTDIFRAPRFRSRYRVPGFPELPYGQSLRATNCHFEPAFECIGAREGAWAVTTNGRKTHIILALISRKVFSFVVFKWISAALGKAPGGLRQPSDPWFCSHYHMAADVVAEWLGATVLVEGRLLDFGCGDGITALGLVQRHGAKNVLGVDISLTQKKLATLAKRELALGRLPRKLQLKVIEPGESLSDKFSVDAICSWSTFEHIDLNLIDGILADLYAMLPKGGRFFLQINPLYYSPSGSHLGRFELPYWAHLLWDEQTVKDAVLGFAGNIPAEELEENFHARTLDEYKLFIFEEYLKLNKITVPELKARLMRVGFRLEREEAGSVSFAPPDVLLEKYPYADLVTDDIKLLLVKP